MPPPTPPGNTPPPAHPAARPARAGRIAVLCVDDNRDVCEAITAIVNAEPDMCAVADAADADAMLEAIARCGPDVAIVDLTMRGKDPLEAIREAAAAHPRTRAIAYSGYDDPETIDSALDAGAWGFVSKSAGPERLVAAVRRVAAGEVCTGMG